MCKNLNFKIFIFFSLFIIPISVFAHSGKTDADGCHMNRKTRDYHCHDKSTTKEARTEARTEAKKYLSSELSKKKNCSYNIFNCPDFKTHAEAQTVFEHCGGVNSDIHH